MEGIDHLLSLEVKKEIADRFFGFRKVIEEDTEAYLKNIENLSVEFRQTVVADFHRIHALLDDDLFAEFLELCGLPDSLLADTNSATSADKGRLFADRNVRGFTRKGCLRNMFLDAYANLYRHIKEYRSSYQHLQEDHQTICEQIRLFYRKNDINTIFHFLRGLESGPAGDLHINTTSSDELEKKMKIEPPPPVEEMLTDIPQPPPEKTIRGELKKLVVKACRRHPRLDPRQFT